MKWPQQRTIQWLASLPVGDPPVIPAQQPDEETVTRWERAVDNDKWREYVFFVHFVLFCFILFCMFFCIRSESSRPGVTKKF